MVTHTESLYDILISKGGRKWKQGLQIFEELQSVVFFQKVGAGLMNQSKRTAQFLKPKNIRQQFSQRKTYFSLF
jgi:hypothetical protein